jgi:septal ring factor EnvC (AmiA/AmiB activator)
MTLNEVPEKIAQNALLQAVARVAMILALPVLIWGLGHISAQGTALNSHDTSIALIQQEQAALDRRLTAQETFNARILEAVTDIANDATKTKTDVGYLRDWVEDIKRQARTP